MLDPIELAKIVEKQITTTVNDQVVEVLASKDWLEPLEQKVIKYSQDRILSKFANSSTMPEIIEAVKQGVAEMFNSGFIPSLENYVDQTAINQAIDLAVQETIQLSLDSLTKDPVWLEKIENLINQAVVQRTMIELSSVDISTVIKQRVDETLQIWKKEPPKNFTSIGIQDSTTTQQVKVTDQNTTINNALSAPSIDVSGAVTVQDLVVKGSINTDNHAWVALSHNIAEKTLEQVTEQWRDQLVSEVQEQIQTNGIAFDSIVIDNEKLLNQGRLSSGIVESNLQTVGALRELRVQGEANINNTVTVKKNRIGINTEDPDSALSIWDEETSISVGKYKIQEGYIGTTRLQGLNIVVNRVPQIVLDTAGLTTISKLRIGQHKLSHSAEVPNWSGTKGDIVFNTNVNDSNLTFAWVCLGAFKWKTIKFTS